MTGYFFRLIPHLCKGLLRRQLSKWNWCTFAHREPSFWPSFWNGSPLVFNSFVGPALIDNNFHMNNGSYFRMIEMSAMSCFAENGAFGMCLRNGWSLILGSQFIRYRHELSAFQKFSIETNIAHYDERWMYLTHTFKDQSGRICAEAIYRSGAYDSKGKSFISPASLMQKLDVIPSEELKKPPTFLDAYLELDKHVRDGISVN
eukprot:TRINITY_DN780086_c0_g1_i1.p1 TRINITY_DN780086_c0_g1~~TRINITY_DN780086_c0_g1_i1.p1  ORF type:complete len:203 (+),score=41.62 TRINITY_DN780086_c0_g1_i1:77-685(+)